MSDATEDAEPEARERLRQSYIERESLKEEIRFAVEQVKATMRHGG